MNMIIGEGGKKVLSEARNLILHSPVNRVASLKQRRDFQRRALRLAVIKRLNELRMAHALLEEKIKNLNPRSVLKRGYSITMKMPEKRVLTDTSGVKEGDHVNVILAEGGLDCLIEKIGIG